MPDPPIKGGPGCLEILVLAILLGAFVIILLRLW